jgi:glycosyltransferase involved in cell wall biosynthesis
VVDRSDEMRISLCMIVRDEAENVERCLESVRGVVDEINVIDTGSSDGTVELLRRLGGRVSETEWRDDFSEARNASLAMAGGDWALILDADEELSTDGARRALEAFAASHPRAIGRVLLSNIEGPGCEGAGSDLDISRFFPLGQGFSFSGRVHEQVVGEEEGVPRFDTGVRVLHHGYQARTIDARSKLERNRRLLEVAIEDDPTDPYSWFHLGRTEFVAEEFGRAADACLKSRQLLAGGDAPYLGALYETAGYALRSLNRSEEALTLLEEVAVRFRRRADTRFLIALLSLDVGRLAQAEEGFRACLELEGEVPEGGETSRSASTWAPAFNLGVMHEVLQQRDLARDWYQRALAFYPEHDASREGLARVGG